MTLRTLRRVDAWIGVPVCFLLTCHRRLFARWQKISPIRRILFVKLAEQGSTVLASDALIRAADRVGRDHVFFLVFQENRAILDVMDRIPASNVLAIDTRTPATVLTSAFSALRRLRALRIDTTVDLEFFARSSAVFAYLTGAGRRVGLHAHGDDGPYRGDLMTHRLVFNPYLHTSQLFRLMIDALDEPAERFPAFSALPPPLPAVPIQYQPPARDLDEARHLVAQHTGLAEVPPIVLLNPNAGDMLPLRKWESGRYVALARRLLVARPELYVVLTGGPGEAADAASIQAEVCSPRCVSLAGQTTMRQLLALYSLSRVLVTNDSGPAHFATLTPIQVITLFGPETPALFAATTPRNHVVWAGLACSPCVSALNNRTSRCRDNLCMKAITVDQVFDAAIRAYDLPQSSDGMRGAAR